MYLHTDYSGAKVCIAVTRDSIRGTEKIEIDGNIIDMLGEGKSPSEPYFGFTMLPDGEKYARIRVKDGVVRYKERPGASWEYLGTLGMLQRPID